MRQMTVRAIPDALQYEIESRASQAGESMNKTVIRLLKQAVGLDRPEPKKRDLSAIAGTWSAQESDEFDENTRIFEQIDQELWR